ncbi:MAG TPA: c-type cytochrome [Planctomycetota bacterium]|nr:c-type cytochrome [Planctomycetota bacterium]
METSSLTKSLAAISVCVTLLLVTLAGGRTEVRGQGSGGDSGGPPADGRVLFAKHCAPCHGERGYGDGPAAYLLNPRPRDLTAYQFRLVSTANGVPTDADLAKVVRNGLLGSSMPPHSQLSEEETLAVVAEVRRIMTEGGMQRMLKEASEAGEPMDEQTARVVAYLEPGPAIPVPVPTPATRESLARGRMLYVLHCASCHDADGTGRTRRDLVDGAGYPLFARNFTAGILKGGGTHTELWRRIRGGMPGTPMPAMDLPDEEVMDLVHYVTSMIRPGASEHATQVRTQITARALRRTSPEASDSDAWRSVPARWFPMTPLWWQDDRIEGVMVQAAHEGGRLGLRMVWEDTTKNDDLNEQLSFSDAAAVQWSMAMNPPFYGMGQPGEEVEIWYWRAALNQVAPDVTSLSQNVVNDIDMSLKELHTGEHRSRSDHPLPSHNPLLITGWGAGNPVSNPNRPPLEILKAAGQGSSTSLRHFSKDVAAAATHDRGYWELVLWRPFQGGEGSLELKVGMRASIAFALWNGQAKDRNGQKNVTIWHEIVLE